MVHTVSLCVKHLCLRALTLKPIPTFCFQIQFALDSNAVKSLITGSEAYWGSYYSKALVTFREPGVFNRGEKGQ